MCFMGRVGLGRMCFVGRVGLGRMRFLCRVLLALWVILLRLRRCLVLLGHRTRGERERAANHYRK
jgi:hypothetical protein